MSWLNNIKKKFLDNEGLFQGGRFTPFQQKPKPVSINNAPPVYNSSVSRNMWNPQTPQLPVIEPPKPVFKTQAAEKLNARLDSIKRYGTSKPVMQAKPQLPPETPFWDRPIGKGLVKTQEALNNQVANDKESFNKYVWNPIKENPALKPTAERFEAAAPAVVRQAKKINLFGLNPQFGEPNDIGQDWDDAKKIGSAALTAYGLAKVPLTAVLGGAAINPIIKAGTNIYENKKGEELNKLNIGQSITGIPDFMQQTPYKEKPITEGLIDAIPEGAGMGLANAGTTRLTNSLVQSLSNYVPILKPLTETSIAKGSPVVTDTVKQGVQKFLSTGGKRLLKSAVVETAVETPIWATLTQSEQETYLQAIEREAVQNLIMNIGMGGVQILGDTKSLTPIVKRSIDTAIDNYWKSASTPQALAMQSGKIDLNAKVDVSKPSIPEVKTEPKTELDWLKQNNKKPETTKSISDIFTNRKTEIGKPQPIVVKGVDVSRDVDKMISEGWTPDQIDYAIKIANQQKLSKPDKNWGAYIRGILKTQSPKQASKMGRPLPQEPSAEEKVYQDWQESKLEESRIDKQNEIAKGEAERQKLDAQRERIEKITTKPQSPSIPEVGGRVNTIANNAVKDINVTDKGSCMLATEKISNDLVSNGIKDFKVVEGYVDLGQGFKPEHTWIELKDGTIIDKTLGQFNGWDTSKVEYLTENQKTFSPSSYSKLAEKYPVSQSPSTPEVKTKINTKIEPEKVKVPTIPEIINPRAASEVVEPKTKSKTAIKEVLPAEQQKIKDANKKVIEEFIAGKWNNQPEAPNYKNRGQNLRYEYRNAEIEDINKIPDLQKRVAVKTARSFDKWWEETNPGKDLPNKSDVLWANVARLENKTKNIELPKSKKIDKILPETKPVAKEPVIEKILKSEKPVSKVAPVSDVPKSTKPVKKLAPETKHYSEAEVNKAIDFESRVVKVGDMAEKEGISLNKKSIQDVLSGKKKVSSKLKAELEKIQAELRAKEIEIGTKVKDESEYHISDVDITKTNTELTSKDNFADVVIGSTFDASKKNTGAVPSRKRADWVDASIAEHRYIMRKQNQTDILTGKIMEENKLPKEKAPEVKKVVEEEINIRKQSQVEADKKIKKGQLPKTDILKIEADKENKLNDLIGNGTKRPEWNLSDNKVGSFNTKKISIDDQLRTEATFFRDKTPPEVFDALIEIRKIEKGMSDVPYSAALRYFYNVATKYDYKDKATYDNVNYYLNRRITTNKITEDLVGKGIRAITRQLSRSQIGLNVKVMAEQPFEVLRIGADDDYGIKKMVKAIRASFNGAEAKRLVEKYGLDYEKSGNVPIKDVLQKQETKGLLGKSIDVMDNLLYKGVAATENWKNIVYVKAAETEGLLKGLKGQDLNSFVEKELIRLAHISDKGMTPKIMDSALGAGALQYKQYSTKQSVLLLNALTSEKPLPDRLKQTGKYLVADYTAKGILAAITGVSVTSLGDWVGSMVEPRFGPLLTIPYNIAKNQYKYMTMDEDDKENYPNPLTNSTAETIKTALTPGGVQFRAKTRKISDILDKGYSESARGNINYVVDEKNPLKIAQALLFGTGALTDKKRADKMWAKIDEDGIYPTLTAAQSATLKRLPKDQQRAYYERQLGLQVKSSDVVKGRTEGNRQTFIEKLFGKKKADPSASLVPSKDATPEEVKKFKSVIKEAMDSGNTDFIKDEEWRDYYFREVDKMSESSEIDKHEKNVERWKKISSIQESDDLDEETKDKIIALSGASKEDIKYYKDSSLDNGSKREILKKLANQEDRNKVIQSLIESKRVVGNRYLASSTDIDYLYDQGLISKAEKALINSWKYDEVKGDFYQDRDYKGGGGGTSYTDYKKLQDALYKLRKSDNENLRKLSNSIKELLVKRPNSKEIQTIGSLFKSGKLLTTQNKINPVTIKRVRRVIELYA